MKLIFLDIDGVMKSKASTIRNGEDFSVMMHPEHVEALNFILESVDDVRIVVTSTYRWMYDVKSLKSMFKEHGIDYKYVASKTPTLESGIRGYEIKEWLDKYIPLLKEKHDTNIDKWIILDDDNDMLGYQQKNFIQTDRVYGLTHFEAQKAINYLNGVTDAPKIVIKRQVKEHGNLKLLKG